jgi:hypothetical protein
MPRGHEPRATRRDDRSQARQAPELPMGPAATTTAYPALFPAARLQARGRERQGRLTAPATPARLRPVLDPTRPLTQDRQLSGNRKRQAPGRTSTRPAGQSGMPATPRNTGKRPLKPRLTRPRSFRDDTEEVRSGEWPAECMCPPLQPKRDCARRATSTTGKCLVNAHGRRCVIGSTSQYEGPGLLTP